MSQYISERIRRFIAERAEYRCEYCRLPQKVAGFAFEIDHIISLKHGGSTYPEHLAYCCPICNGHKGSDVGTFINGQLVRFFNPCTDDWFKHFEVQEGWIAGLTAIGEATASIFGFNEIEDVMQRQKLMHIGLFP